MASGHQAKPDSREPVVTIAALYVQKDGAYYGLEGVDPWPEERDARLYAGPHPVVAHPPCNKWSPLAYINRRRLPNYEIGDDGGCFEAALRSVRAYGGVLEHPASSLAWGRFLLPHGVRGYWVNTLERENEWVTVVDQGAYGHRAQKTTQLLYVGSNPPLLDWSISRSNVLVSGFLHHKGTDESRRVRPKEASRTPIAFRDVLLAMARNARREAVAA